MDNYEWAMGYESRIELVHVDYESQKKMIKESVCWYEFVIENNRGKL